MFLLQATKSSIQQLEHHRYPIQGVKPIQDSGDMKVNMASYTFSGLCPFSGAPSTSLHQSLYKIVSSFIDFWKRGKLSHLPLGFWNLHLALVHSLHMGWFHLIQTFKSTPRHQYLLQCSLHILVQLAGSNIFILT